jgi:hypothetical protein
MYIIGGVMSMRRTQEEKKGREGREESQYDKKDGDARDIAP